MAKEHILVRAKVAKVGSLSGNPKMTSVHSVIFLSVMCHQDGLPFKRYIIRNKSEENRSYTEYKIGQMIFALPSVEICLTVREAVKNVLADFAC